MRLRVYLATLGLLFAGGLAADPLIVRAGFSELVFDGRSASPVAWHLCLPQCFQDGAQRMTVFDADDGYMRFRPTGGADVDAVPGDEVTVSVPADNAMRIQDGADVVTLSFTTAAGDLSYRLFKNRPEMQLDVPSDMALEFASGAKFVPEQLPGFGAMYSRALAVQVSASGQQLFDDESADGAAQTTANGSNWTGVRNRYWTFLLQPQTDSVVNLSVAASEPNRPVLSFTAQSMPQSYRVYAGPIEWETIREVSPELSELLFAALWDFLRALTFGMMMLFDLIYGVVGHYGVAIILLSLTVKVLMYPLTRLADSWQAQVNATASLLQPELDAIRRSFKGEEAHMKVLEVYKKHNVSQFYTFKSAAGFLIQIPVFIAAFDMLGENIALSEATFFWIADLAKPDHLAALPFVLPFFGGYLNLLPFLMTALSTLAAVLQQEDTLSAELQRQQSQRLYLMAAAFFVLFYTFPAGMVLYWTSSNLFHLLKVESGRLFVRE